MLSCCLDRFVVSSCGGQWHLAEQGHATMRIMDLGSWTLDLAVARGSLVDGDPAPWILGLGSRILDLTVPRGSLAVLGALGPVLGTLIRFSSA